MVLVFNQTKRVEEKPKEENMAVTMKELLEAGVHFGHQTKRWDPRMKKYIFTARNGIYIIDLQQTVKMFKDAYEFVRDEIAAQGKKIIFVGTKKQAQESLKEEAERCGMFYINQRWLGGLLTNFKTIKKSIDKLKKLESMQEEGILELLPKKEAMKLSKEMGRLQKLLGGIKDMTELPGALFVIDIKREQLAVNEAKKLGIPIVAVVDTNCNPEEVDYVIPGNDDAIRAIKLFCSKIANGVIEGKRIHEETLNAEADKDSEEVTIQEN
jgi:small subunit ribosomal protein S2